MRIALKSSRRKWVAMDCDSRQVRLVVFEYAAGTPIIRSLHAASVPGEIKPGDVPALGRHLKAMVDRLGLGGARAVMSAGRSQVVLKSLTMPPGSTANELPSMVQFQLGKELPFPSDEAVADFTFGAHWDSGQEETTGEGVTVLAAAVRLPVVDAARGLCTEAGLKLQRLMFRPHANLRGVQRCVELKPDERLLYVELTADEVEIDVMSGQGLEFSRSAKVAWAEEGQPAPDRPSAEARDAVLKRVLGEVTRSVAGYQATRPGEAVHACLVAGSTGLEPEVVEALSGRLEVRCERFDPSGGYGVLPDEQVSGFGAALGMASSRQAEAPPLDFLNPKRPAPQRDVRKVRLYLAAGAAVLMLGGSALARHMYLGGFRTEAEALRQTNAKLEATNKALRKVQAPVQSIREWMSGDVDWLGQLAHLSNTLPPADQLYLLSFRTGGSNLVSLNGRTKDEKNVADFSKKMTEMTGYKVRPKGVSPATADPYGYGSDFTLDLVVEPSAKPVLTTTAPVRRPADDANAGGGAPQPAGGERRTIRPTRRGNG